MQTAAVRVFHDRPSTLPDPDNPGWIDYIAIHDAEHLRCRAEWRRRYFQSHPDHGGNDLVFDRTRRAQKRWEDAELAWYAKRGLALPEPQKALVPRKMPTWGKRDSGPDKLLRLLSDCQQHSFSECRGVVGRWFPSYASRLRKRGYDVIARRGSYQLLYSERSLE